MQLLKRSFLLLAITFSLTFCAQKDMFQKQFPEEITVTNYQKWVGGRRETGSGIVFFLQLKNELPSNIVLKKIYFEKSVANFEAQSGGAYAASLNRKPVDLENVSDDNQGSTSKQIVTPKFELKPNEAILEYTIDQKTMYYKVTNIVEKEFQAYP
jgi:hypothetical protein